MYSYEQQNVWPPGGLNISTDSKVQRSQYVTMLRFTYAFYHIT